MLRFTLLTGIGAELPLAFFFWPYRHMVLDTSLPFTSCSETVRRYGALGKPASCSCRPVRANPAPQGGVVAIRVLAFPE